MKTKEELNALKSEVEALSKKLRELTEEELAQVIGGSITPPDMPKTTSDEQNGISFDLPGDEKLYNFHIYPNP